MACGAPGSDGADSTDPSPAAGPASAAASSPAPDSLVSDPALERADSIVSSWMDDGRIPGAVLAVSMGGTVVFEEAYGAAQTFSYGTGQYDDPEGIEAVASPRPMTPETVFDLASVTKVMATTFAIMRLVDDGLVELDAPVATYLSGFTGGGKEQIRVRHLLNHTSGLQQWVPTYYHASDGDEAYAYIRDLPLGWTVGSGRHYSDLGFMLLGRIVETVSGQPLDVFVARSIYRPLGLTTTGFRPRADGTAPDSRGEPDGGSSGRSGAGEEPFAATSHGNPYERRMVHDPEFGYRIDGDADAWDGWRERTLVGEVNDGNAYHAFGGVAGHAGLFSTARELLPLLELMLGGGELGERRHLTAETVERFLEPVLDGQALGWLLPDYAPEGSFGHTGFTGTFVLGVPGRELAIVLLTNRQNLGVDDETRYPDVGPLQRAVARALTEPGAP